jgi:mono/diheme cytochrome c family protein
MPAYAKEVLSDQQVADIHAFLRSLPGPRPVADIPQLAP